ncbi:GNAT family N-acetyltransferase [Thalassotalea sp. G2M2-11]|uniref:GNAT family N-acetyltransferase n=1 Tax=Thalassotalea sp. G2M2-11 TaxID=2787627 RepID=UPI0019CF90A1|nr:GNAT family N-acetyltransferase [Thalassotalea sp. G2M2-11]
MIRTAVINDAQAIAQIYNYYIKDTVITFEEQMVTADEMAQRIQTITQSNHIWLVLEIEGELLGYAYSTKWRDRSAYRFASEITVYLTPHCHGKGYGTALYTELFKQLQLNTEINTVIAGITLPNQASVALHEKLGLKKVAHFEQVGLKFGQWLDVGYWQMALS